MGNTIGIIYSGAGGAALGAHMAGMKIVWGVDNNKDAIATFNKNITNGVLADVDEIEWEDLGYADTLFFAMPFQKINLKDLGIYQDAIDSIKFLRPQYFLVSFDTKLTYMFNDESSGRRGKALLRKFGSLTEYYVEKDIIKYHDFGVPQMRTQAFFAGTRIGNYPYSFPKYVYVHHVNSKEALAKMPRVMYNHEIMDKPSKIQHVTHTEGYSPVDNNVIIRKKTHENPEPQSRKLDPNMLSFAIMDRGFDAVFQHPIHNRKITNREMARLQSFPDWFAFIGNHDSVRKQVAQAIPPLGAKKTNKFATNK